MNIFKNLFLANKKVENKERSNQKVFDQYEEIGERSKN